MSIVSRIQAIEQHLEDDYSVLELAGSDLTNVDKNIVNLKPTWKERLLYFINNGTEEVYERWDKVEGEGEEISLNNTLEAKMKIKLKGNTYQYSTSGKNLFDENQLLQADGWTLNSNGYYNGLFDKYYVAFRNGFTFNTTFEENTQYTIQVNAYCTGGSPRFRVDYTDNTYSQINLNATTPTDYTFTTTSGKTISKIVGEYGTGSSQTLYLKNIQLEQGSSCTSYEPYTNGASPNPDYPQEIQVVSGDNSIEVCGKNRLYNQNAPFTSADVNITYNNGIFGLNGTATGSRNAYIIPYDTSIIHLEAGESLTYYIERVSGTSKVFFLTYFLPDDNSSAETNWGVTLEANTNSNKVVKTATKSGNVKYVQFFIDNGVKYNSEVKILVQKGNITTPVYEPYTGASYPINLPVENLVDLKGIGTQTSNGITITDNNDGTYTLNGTATANIVFSKNISTTLPIGTYTYAMNNSAVVGTNASTSVYCYLLATETGTNWLFDRYSYQATNSSVTTTTTQSYSLNTFRIVIPNGAVLNNLTIGYQIEKGSKKNSFTPYGTTPIELCKIGTYQDKIDKSTGKNLLDLNRTLGTPSDTNYANTTKRTFDFSKFVAGITGNNYYLPTNISSYEVANNSVKLTATGGGYGLGFPLKVKASQNYKLSYSISASGSETTSVGYYQSDGTFISENRALGTHNYIDITTPSNCDFMVIVFRPPVNTETTYSNIMLNEGSTALPYEPYGTSWYLKKEIGKVVLNGSETWQDRPNYNTWDRFVLDTRTLPTQTVKGYSQYFNVDFKINNELGYIYENVGTQIGCNFSAKGTTTLEQFKTWLSTHNTELYYVLATPTYTLIEGELLNQLEAIKMSYEGQTNISQINNLASVLNASALTQM